MTENYPRDLAGYGPNPPDPQWPGGARLALQVVLNYEEGGENCVLHGDPASETFLSEIMGADARVGVRHMSMESVYEYGSRVGVWRLKRLFEGRFHEWNNANIAALQRVRHWLAADARAQLDWFASARQGPLGQRLRALRNSGVYRQTRRGTLALWVAALTRRL